MNNNDIFYIYNKRTVSKDTLNAIKSNTYLEYVDYSQYYNKCENNISCISFYYKCGNKKTLLFSDLYKTNEWINMIHNMNTILLMDKMKKYIIETENYKYNKELSEIEGTSFTDKIPIKPQVVYHTQMIL